MAWNMKVWLLLFLAAGSVSLQQTSPSEAALLRGSCKADYAKWKTKPGWKAFAKTTDGYSCGVSWGFGTEEAAKARALTECRKSRRHCRILATDGPSSAKRRPTRRTSTRQFHLSSVCQRSYENWKEKSNFKAFLTSNNGASCHTTWGARSLYVAIKNAKEGCISTSDCNLFDIGAPDLQIKTWQQDLKVLGLYEAEIDGDWGSGSRSAMARFAKLADLPDDYGRQILERLKWAAQIRTLYDLPIGDAVAESEKAAKTKSLDYLKTKLPSERPPAASDGIENEIAAVKNTVRSQDDGWCRFQRTSGEVVFDKTCRIRINGSISKCDPIKGVSSGYELVFSGSRSIRIESRCASNGGDAGVPYELKVDGSPATIHSQSLNGRSYFMLELHDGSELDFTFGEPISLIEGSPWGERWSSKGQRGLCIKSVDAKVVSVPCIRSEKCTEYLGFQSSSVCTVQFTQSDGTVLVVEESRDEGVYEAHHAFLGELAVFKGKDKTCYSRNSAGWKYCFDAHSSGELVPLGSLNQ